MRKSLVKPADFIVSVMGSAWSRSGTTENNTRWIRRSLAHCTKKHETFVVDVPQRHRAKTKIYERCGIISRRYKNCFFSVFSSHSLNPGAAIVEKSCGVTRRR